jgi:hypothetical protein
MLSVQEQLRDGVVLVSGGTGFLASCALEKLLRSTEVRQGLPDVALLGCGSRP